MSSTLKTYPTKEAEEEARWIHCQIFKEIYYEMDEKDRPPIKKYCQDLFTEEDMFNLIGTRRQLMEDYEFLRETGKDSNPLVALGNLMLEMADYDRAEHFYTEALRAEENNPINQVKILNKLITTTTKSNQIEKVNNFRDQMAKVKSQIH